MAIFKSISSITNSTGSLNSSISTRNVGGSLSYDNSVSFFDGGLSGCGGLGGFNGLNGCFDPRNTNIINLDIDIVRRHRCC
ncbi:hypothetical protein RB653_006028 [Dictyostelium firmibasis]|uniref:Uncharacterized protein n=1 Tax=Dictyostelium firmibasis TaxID=79012 RepID=A0AAN7U932_9MYCE